MKLSKDVLAELRVEPGAPARLDHRSTEFLTADWLPSSGKKDGTQLQKKASQDDLKSFVKELSTAQALLWADGTHAVLIVLQALDAGGQGRHHQARHVRRESAGMSSGGL